MKTLKTFFVFAIGLLCLVNNYGQLKVIPNGNVIIGTSTPTFKLQVDGSLYSSSIRTDGTFQIGTAGKFIIPTSGNVGIGVASPSYKLHVEGNVRTGSLSTVVFSIDSDIRLKENIVNYNSSLANIMKIQPVTYNLKLPMRKAIAANNANEVSPTGNLPAGQDLSLQKVSSTGATMVADTAGVSEIYNRSHIGFLAQEIQKIYPELVYTDKKGKMSIDYVSMIPILVAAMKEQQEQINKLNSELAALKAKK